MRSVGLGLVVLVAGLAAGCANYEYRVVQPASAAQLISKEGVTFQYPPLEYKVASRSDRVAMRITNPTDAPVRIEPDRSYVVDPWGATHPTRPRLIAPHSYVDMSLPPLVQSYYTTYYGYPYFGFRPYAYPYWDAGYAIGPTYSYSILTPYDWKWKGEGETRLHLGFIQANTNRFDHEIVINRRKMK